MKIQTGNPVGGENYFKRPRLIEKAWDMIEASNHILIAAPRRVGKTSLLIHLRENPKDHYNMLLIDTESINSENEFFRKIVNRILRTDYVRKSQKVLTFLEKHKPTIKKVGPDGVEFGVSEEHDYLNMLTRILKSSDSKTNKLVIMLDEFTQTLENIIVDEGESSGRHFLQSNRELRQDKEISSCVQFIYTGSIGLENVVSSMNLIGSINDLSRLEIPPLNKKEAQQLITLLIENVDFDLSKSITDYILQQIEWLIPFYFQLILDELRNLHRDENFNQVTEAIVNQALDGMLKQRQHFEHWHTRLRGSLKGGEYNFVKELLNLISENNTIDSNEI
ncbi:ATP-binding protein, partial [candidate division KSB1 bacterium]|nr:ATP-binding protein [candidate division KSB1 bacterium]